jgi:5'-deoxynucleotidase YfbR-like HD superfamily hydrolase
MFEECSVTRKAREQLARRIGQGSLLDRVRVTREGAAVERCHQLPHALRYSVGHHTLDLMSLLTLSWKLAHDGELPRAELLVAAMYHDTPGERVIGDISSPVKRAIHCEELDEIEVEAQRRIGIEVELTDEENEYLIGADRVELWTREQVELLGNKAAESFSQGVDVSMDAQPPPWPMLDLVEEVRAQGIGRLPGNILKEWGGLNA